MLGHENNICGFLNFYPVIALQPYKNKFSANSQLCKTCHTAFNDKKSITYQCIQSILIIIKFFFFLQQHCLNNMIKLD